MHQQNKKVPIKNLRCYYFDYITKLEDFIIDKILVDEKSHKNILIYDISSNPLRIRFDKIDGFIRIYDRTRYLTWLGSEKYDAIYNRMRYFKSLKSSITYIFLTITQKSKLILMILYLQKKRLILHNVIILIKSVLNIDQNRYYYKIFL